MVPLKNRRFGEGNSLTILKKGKKVNIKEKRQEITIEPKAPAFITIEADKTLVQNLVITGNPHAVIVSKTMEGLNPELILNSILELGSTMLLHGANKATVDTVASEVDRLVDTVLGVTLKEYPELMQQQSQKVTKELFDLVDPAKSTSIHSQMRDLMKDFSAVLKSEVVKTLIEPNNPLSVLRNELISKLNSADERYGNLLKEVTTLSERMTSSASIQNIRNQSTLKGADHEQVVLGILERVHSPFQDIVTDTSQDIGGSARKTGDFVVDLNITERLTEPLKVVVEAKNTRLSLPAALKELDECIANRGASVGVLVFKDITQSPTSGQLIRLYPGNRIIVSFVDGQSMPVEVAFALARNIALANVATNKGKVSKKDIQCVISEITESVEKSRKISRHIAITRRSVDEIENLYEELRTNIFQVIEEIKV